MRLQTAVSPLPMAKKPITHPYSDLSTFQRLMLLIATIIKYPGVGAFTSEETPTEEHRNGLQELQIYLQKTASEFNIELTNYSLPTINKDLQRLRDYGILDRRMYRWGYYLGTGAMSQHELRVAFEALASAAKYQGNPQTRRIYETLSKRLRGLDLELKGQLFYPVRQYLNRAINYTDPEEMMAKRENRNNLFHQLDLVEDAISQGQAIEIYRSSDPYRQNNIGFMQVWPLQLIYYDIAWYLIYENYSNNHLVVARINRFTNSCQILNPNGRSLILQYQSLNKAHKLLENGWGLNLGQIEEQQAELRGELKFETVKVNFFPPIIPFIMEGERRHPNQKITPGPKDKLTRQPAYITYEISLPPRSLNEFSFWLHRYSYNAQVISPPELVEKHRQAAEALIKRYSQEEK